MRYPSEFSSEARAVVEAAMIRARRKHLKAKKSERPFDDARSVRTWILSIFLVFARQAIALGTHGVWDVDEVRSQTFEGLRLITIMVAHTAGFGRWIGNWGGHINSDVMREFEAAPEWQQFEDELLVLAESKAGGVRDENVPSAQETPDPVDLDAFPLGENPFPEGHPANQAFDEATWRAKEKINKFKSELLQAPSRTPTEFLQAALTYRKQWFSACAFEMTLIVGNRDTALWYEQWIDERVGFLIADTMAGLRRPNPNANLGDASFFTAQELENAQNELTVELARMVANYKGVAAAGVQEALRLSKAQISHIIERLERLKPILPDLSPAGLARTNAASERCDAIVGKAKLKQEALLREARTNPYEGQRARELKRQACEVLQTAQDEASVLMLDAQAEEYISLVGDFFPNQTLWILTATSIKMYGGKDAAGLREKEWRARWWERKAAEASSTEAASASGIADSKDKTSQYENGSMSPNEANNPELDRRRNKEAADLTALYSRFRGRNPSEAGRQEELLRDARAYAGMNLTRALEELELPRNASDADQESAYARIADRIVLDALTNYVPSHKYRSDFQLGAREFRSALWIEGFPSLEDRARAAIEELAALTVVESAPIQAPVAGNTGIEVSGSIVQEPLVPEQPGGMVRRSRRGPRRDYDTALKVAGVIERVAPEGNWRELLDTVCDELDEAKVQRPKPWKQKGYLSWYACCAGERTLVIKAIGHHQERAREHKETFS